MCTVVVSIQNVTCWPVLLVPSQNCCGPTVMFPDGGTTRSTSIASGQPAGSTTAGISACPGGGLVTGARSAGAHKLRASPVTGDGPDFSAGASLSRDWGGRRWLYSARHLSTAAWASSIELNGPASLRNSICRV